MMMKEPPKSQISFNTSSIRLLFLITLAFVLILCYLFSLQINSFYQGTVPRFYSNLANEDSLNATNQPRIANIRAANRSKGLPRIFCVVLSTPNNFKITSALTALNTWVYKCDNYHFIAKLPNKLSSNPIEEENGVSKYKNAYLTNFFGNEIGEPLNILHPEGYFEEDAYMKLTYKVLYAIRSIYMKHYGNYDWYIKADTDTFVHLNNLKKFLKDKDPQNPVTYG
jgi:hypothetical protein